MVETMEFVETEAESVDQCLHCLHLSPHKTSSTGKIFKKSVGIKNGFPLLKTPVEIVEIVETIPIICGQQSVKFLQSSTL
jgi:hypothetical protein